MTSGESEPALVAEQQEEIDDFDFHVEFPTPDVSDCETIWPQSKTASSTDEKAVLIVLLGWAGAVDKHLAKYSEFYLKRGCIVLRCIAPIKSLFIEPAKLPILARKIVCLLKDLQLSSHPTFFHVFSNGGSFLYSHILRVVAAEEKYEFDFKGTVFDSAPAPRSFRSVFRAVANIYGQYPRMRWVIAAFFVVFLISQVFWYHFKSAVRCCFVIDPYEKLSSKKSGDFLVGEHPLANWLVRISRVKNYAFLFLYSDEDQLIRSHAVEKVAQSVRENGNHVDLVKFEKSEHVQHYRTHPEQYIEAVTTFIRKRMNEDSGPIVFWNET